MADALSVDEMDERGGEDSTTNNKVRTNVYKEPTQIVLLPIESDESTPTILYKSSLVNLYNQIITDENMKEKVLIKVGSEAFYEFSNIVENIGSDMEDVIIFDRNVKRIFYTIQNFAFVSLTNDIDPNLYEPLSNVSLTVSLFCSLQQLIENDPRLKERVVSQFGPQVYISFCEVVSNSLWNGEDYVLTNIQENILNYHSIRNTVLEDILLKFRSVYQKIKEEDYAISGILYKFSKEYREAMDKLSLIMKASKNSQILEMEKLEFDFDFLKSIKSQIKQRKLKRSCDTQQNFLNMELEIPNNKKSKKQKMVVCITLPTVNMVNCYSKFNIPFEHSLDQANEGSINIPEGFVDLSIPEITAEKDDFDYGYLETDTLEVLLENDTIDPLEDPLSTTNDHVDNEELCTSRFPCEKCTKVFVSFDDLFNHNILTHFCNQVLKILEKNQMAQNTPALTCPKTSCHKVFNTDDTLLIHFAEQHTNIKSKHILARSNNLTSLLLQKEEDSIKKTSNSPVLKEIPRALKSLNIKSKYNGENCKDETNIGKIMNETVLAKPNEIKKSVELDPQIVQSRFRFRQKDAQYFQRLANVDKMDEREGEDVSVVRKKKEKRKMRATLSEETCFSVDSPKQAGKVPCRLCKKIYNGSTIKKHMASHLPKSHWPWECPLCGLKGQSWSDVVRHMKTSVHANDNIEVYLSHTFEPVKCNNTSPTQYFNQFEDEDEEENLLHENEEEVDNPTSTMVKERVDHPYTKGEYFKNFLPENEIEEEVVYQPNIMVKEMADSPYKMEQNEKEWQDEESLGKGWKKKSVEGKKGRKDHYYRSPEGKIYNSMAKVKKVIDYEIPPIKVIEKRKSCPIGEGKKENDEKPPVKVNEKIEKRQSSPTQYFNHLLTKKKDVPPQGNSFNCQFCDEKFDTIEAFTCHQGLCTSNKHNNDSITEKDINNKKSTDKVLFPKISLHRLMMNKPPLRRRPLKMHENESKQEREICSSKTDYRNITSKRPVVSLKRLSASVIKTKMENILISKQDTP